MTGDLDYATADSMTVSGGKAVSVSTPLTSATGTFVVTVNAGTAKQTVSQWQIGAVEVAGYTVAANTEMKDTTKIDYTFTVTADNTYLSGIAFS
ncbi:MAG: hypothetical protein IJU75_00090 [Clostridia bacterium]|nr:hypothetical protein [Clostridia bacterium]